MLYLKALILSLIQSLTEFIPVSSSGHLVIFGNYLNFNSVDAVLFNAIIQLASTLAIIVFFRKKLFNVLFTLYNSKQSRKFTYNFLIAFLPCAVFGLIFYKYIKLYLYSDSIIAITLIFGGIAFLIIDRLNIKVLFKNIDDVDKISSLKVGLYQILSMVPGVSRSGSTIAGGLLSKMSRKTAVEFSFILAIPTVLSATLLDLYKNIDKINSNNIYLLLFGFIITFLLSMLVIKWFLKYISEHNFNIFGYYRIILGIMVIIIKTVL